MDRNVRMLGVGMLLIVISFGSCIFYMSRNTREATAAEETVRQMKHELAQAMVARQVAEAATADAVAGRKNATRTAAKANEKVAIAFKAGAQAQQELTEALAVKAATVATKAASNMQSPLTDTGDGIRPIEEKLRELRHKASGASETTTTTVTGLKPREDLLKPSRGNSTTYSSLPPTQPETETLSSFAAEALNSFSLKYIERRSVQAHEHSELPKQFVSAEGMLSAVILPCSSTNASIEGLANRILSRLLKSSSSTHSPEFRIAVGGYSVSAGRGNWANQTFANRIRALLSDQFSKFGLKLSVVNHAIGGVPSFPYAFCSEDFYGPSPDLISWDFSMNEASKRDATTFEAYLRRVYTAYSGGTDGKGDWAGREGGHAEKGAIDHESTRARTPPALFVIDHSQGGRASSRKARFEQVKRYSGEGAFRDSFFVDTAVGSAAFQRWGQNAPSGFSHWPEYTAPKNNKQNKWHPGYQWHEFVAQAVSVHILKALDRAAEKLRDGARPPDRLFVTPLPPPQHCGLDSKFVGCGGKKKDLWASCWTSYLPTFEKKKSLRNIIVERDGDADNATTWKFRASLAEKAAKESMAFLGYIDAKLAIEIGATSPPLKLRLPMAKERNDFSSIKILIVCMPQDAKMVDCSLTSSLDFSSDTCNFSQPASFEVLTRYKGQSTCAHMNVTSCKAVERNKRQASVDLVIKVKLDARPRVKCSISHVITLFGR